MGRLLHAGTSRAQELSYPTFLGYETLSENVVAATIQ